MEKQDLEKTLSKENWTWFRGNPERMVRVRQLLEGEASYYGCGVQQPYVMVLKRTNSDYLERRGISNVGMRIVSPDDIDEDIYMPVDGDEYSSILMWQVVDALEDSGEQVVTIDGFHYWLTEAA